MLLNRLRAHLRTLRTRHELTQEALSEISGVSYKFYQRIENDQSKRELKISTVEKLAAPFGLEAWQLLAPELPDATRLIRAKTGRKRTS
ncbi:MAG: helix-turn-helix transcriptional regulator [Opitutae bacterium]|nr:helix-turn-helix transcriptional regulator [Opitutae bacterium]